MKNSTTLDADDLLRGAFYAFEQAGRLLHDAVSLWNEQRYSSAVVLCVFAREEIGRFKILLQERVEALNSGPRNVEAVRKLCNDHKEKLRTAPAGMTLHFNASAPGLEGLHADPQSAEFKKAHALLDQRMQQKAEAQPKNTHAARMTALYVDVDDMTKAWNRPADVTAGMAGLLMQEVANDYAHRFSYLANPNDYFREPVEAFLAWADRPALLEPVWADLSNVVLPVEE